VNEVVTVLGGTGMVGRALVAAWPPAGRRRLRLLVHRSRPDWLAAHDAEAHAVDPASTDDLRRAVDGATAFIDLLPPTGDGTRRATTERLGEALAGSGVARVVHASSIDVYGATRAPVVDAETTPEPTSAYAREHLDAEAVALRRPIGTTVVRLGAVFGAGSRSLVTLADEVATAPAWRLAARRALSGAQRLHLVSVETVTQTLIALLDADDPPSRLVVTDDAAPENDFAHAQDLLIAALHRPDVSRTPAVPGAVRQAVLAWRGQPAGLATRRFATGPLEALAPSAAARFPVRLRAYIDQLAAARLVPGRSAT
jgi:nucleoside-diphosphate-sugar epimerase